MKRSSPLDGAFRKICDLVEKHRRQGRLRLPTQREIAAQTGLSYYCVQRVMRGMKEAGIVRTSHRSGAFVEKSAMTTATLDRARLLVSNPPRRSWARIAGSLTDDIHAGLLGPGRQLPPIKGLRSRFAANYRTVRQALETLEKEHIVERHGRGYRVTQTGPRQSSGAIIVIARARHPIVLMNHTRNSRPFWETLEHECIRLHVRSEVYGQDEEGNLARWKDPATYSISDIMKKYPVLGFCVWSHNMERAWFTRLMGALRTTGKPASIFQEDTAVPLDEMARVCGNVSRMAIFPLAIDSEPGVQVASFLLERGHRSVAVFSFAQAAYENRVRGMRHLFHSAQVQMSEFWVDFPNRYSELLTEKYHPMNEKYVEAERKMGEMDSWLSSRFEEYTNIDRTFVDRALTREFVYTTCRPLFEQALADPSITAWVGGNDTIALAALRFLRARSVDVPGKISVVGFDNHHESFAQGLSSFDFNGRAATIAMLNHIMRPPTSREMVTRIHYTPGIIIERSSTRATR